jgi:hypothetical protein
VGSSAELGLDVVAVGLVLLFLAVASGLAGLDVVGLVLAVAGDVVGLAVLFLGAFLRQLRALAPGAASSSAPSPSRPCSPGSR